MKCSGTVQVISISVLAISFCLVYMTELAGEVFGNLCQGPQIEMYCAGSLPVSLNASGNATAAAAGNFSVNASNSTDDECTCSEALLDYGFLLTGQTFTWLKTAIIIGVWDLGPSSPLPILPEPSQTFSPESVHNITQL